MQSEANGLVFEEDVRLRLQEVWLPQLERAKSHRKPLKWLMICLITVPLALALCLMVTMALQGDEIVSQQGGVAVTMMSLSILGFRALGKLQACDDTTLQMSAAVAIGDRKLFESSLENLACYSQFKGLVAQMGKVLG